MQDSDSSLITLERSQKLDLLIHLVANLRQSLVICGPSGIGKTTLLDELKARKFGDWPMMAIQASNGLSFEHIQKQIFQFLLQHYPEFENQDLASVISSLDEQSQKIVVIIDDAGQLVPGLISHVILYAAASTCLRVVFSLTQDELHLKSSSDSLIDECHFIEIPPLTEKQCTTFLQNLSGRPDAVVPFSAINESMVEKVYRQTHGIPGKIMSELPNLPKYKKEGVFIWMVTFFFIAIFVAIGVKLFVFDGLDERSEKQKIKTALVLNKVKENRVSTLAPAIYPKKQDIAESVMQDDGVDEVTVPASVVVDTKAMSATNIESTDIKIQAAPLKPQDKDQEIEIKVDEVKKAEAIIEKKKALVEINKVADKELIVVEKKKDVTKKIQKHERNKVNKLVNVTNDDGQWVLKQPKKNYAIQLIVLSKRESVDEFLNNNKILKEQLKFFRINNQGQKYVVIYGSFKNAVSASKKMKSLPVKYRKSWVRSFGELQKKIKK